MVTVNRPLLLVTALTLSASGLAAFLSACTDNGSAGTGGPGGPGTAADARSDSPIGELDGSTQEDAPSNLSTCEQTHQYITECNKLAPDGGDVPTCGEAKFDEWCRMNDEVINSASFRRAESMCLTAKNCAGLDRRDCEYRTYATATPTAAQVAVVEAYCKMCEPADQADCAKRKTTYNPAKGPKSTDDVFVAAWELSDKLDEQIRMRCTGPAVDAGPDAAACLKQFANCAGGIYVDALPDCPK